MGIFPPMPPAPSQLRYKFLRDGLKSQYGDIVWKIGESQKATGELALCKNGFHCSQTPYDAFRNTQGEVLAEVAVAGERILGIDKECWEKMRIINAYKWHKDDTILLALFAARFLLKIYEKRYPTDPRPRKALEAAEAYHACPCPQHQLAVTRACEGVKEASRSAFDERNFQIGIAAFGIRDASSALFAPGFNWKDFFIFLENFSATECNKWMIEHIKTLEIIGSAD